MELDFTKLNSLAFAGFTEIPPGKQPSKTPSEPFLEDGRYKTPPEEENALQGQIEGLQGISNLQREADSIKEERERAKAVYREYQKNIKTSGQLQTALLKGARQGEDIYSLFLKAVKAISLMTSNKAFYSQIEDDIKTIYGAGLLELKPLELELEEVEGRLQRLREAYQRETEPADSLQRIASAIKAHEQRATQLKGMLAQGGESLTA